MKWEKFKFFGTGQKTKANSGNRHSRTGIILVFGLLALLATGCATVDPKPFTKFNALAKELSGVDNVAQTQFQQEKEFWMSKYGTDPKQAAGLFLTIIPDYDYKFSFKDDVPYFIKWKQFQSGISGLNSGFIRYTELLAELAGGDLIKGEDFKKLAEDLNTNLRDALLALNPPKEGESGPDEKGPALFSTVAAEGARTLIEYKRKEKLIEILTDNQEKVDTILGHAKEGIEIMADNTRVMYEFNSNKVRNSLPSLAINKRQAQSESIYADSLVTATTLDLLKSLANTYDSLSSAHRNLAASLEDDQISLSALSSNISRVVKLYKELAKANEEAEKSRTAAQ